MSKRICIVEYLQETDFDFGELPGLAENNDTTSMAPMNVTQQTLKSRLQQDEQLLLGDDAGSGVDVEEASGDEMSTTEEDDVTVTTTTTTTTMMTTTTQAETTAAHETTSLAPATTSSPPQTTTMTTTATLPTLTTEEPVSGEPG